MNDDSGATKEGSSPLARNERERISDISADPIRSMTPDAKGDGRPPPAPRKSSIFLGPRHTYPTLDEFYFDDRSPPADRWLYHYTSLETLDAISASKSLRLSRLDRVNDPQEARPFNAMTFLGRPLEPGDPAFQEEFDALQAARAIITEEFNKAHVLCLSRDTKDSSGLVRRGYAISALWAHYGDKHAGVCLALDRTLLHERLRKAYGEESVIGAPVSYDTARTTGATWGVHSQDLLSRGLIAFRKDVREFLPNRWLVKDEDWGAEREYRFLVRDLQTEFAYIDIEGCVVGICAGDRFPPHSRQRLATFARRLGISHTPPIFWDSGYGQARVSMAPNVVGRRPLDTLG